MTSDARALKRLSEQVKKTKAVSLSNITFNLKSIGKIFKIGKKRDGTFLFFAIFENSVFSEF